MGIAVRFVSWSGIGGSVVGPFAACVWHAIWTPFAQPVVMKKFMISCVISAGKVSPYSAPGIKFSYLQSVTFLTHCCAVVQRTPIAPDSNYTTGSALLHPFTCSTAHAMAPDGSTANSLQPLRFRTWGCARTFSAHEAKRESVETHLERPAPMLLMHVLSEGDALSAGRILF